MILPNSSVHRWTGRNLPHVDIEGLLENSKNLFDGCPTYLAIAMIALSPKEEEIHCTSPDTPPDFVGPKCSSLEKRFIVCKQVPLLVFDQDERLGMYAVVSVYEKDDPNKKELLLFVSVQSFGGFTVEIENVPDELIGKWKSFQDISQEPIQETD